MNEPKIIGKPNCLLGEGIFWDDIAGKIRQFDINSSELITITPNDGTYTVETLPQKGTCMAEFADGSFLYGMEDGVYDSRFARICLKEPITGARFNDGKAGPDGLFYLGTIERGGNAVLYRLEGGKLTRMVENARVSNGLDFSADGKTVYYIDTPTRKIEAFDFPSFTNRRTVFAFDDNIVGNPDGMCMDADGMLWTALWGGHAVVQIDPKKGKLLQKIELPASYISCPTFVGKDLSLLAVTSAKHDKELSEEPNAGSTFLLDVGVKGRKPCLLDKDKVLARRVALVTGAGTGIGSVIATELAKAGYDVAIHCSNSVNGANATAEKVRTLGRRAAVIRADLSSYEGTGLLFDEFSKKFDRLDLFVNNAGITEKSAFLETDEALFDRVMNVDFKGAYFCMQRAARLMANNGIHGSIVLISSNNARAHFADVSVYGAVKAGIQKAAEHMAVELAKYRIRVNIVAPGWTDTGSARLDAKETTYYKVPLGRWATPAEIAHAVLYLSDDMADSITGSTIVIDGGALMVSDKASRYGFYHD